MKYLVFTFFILINANLFSQTNDVETINIGEKIRLFSSILDEEREIFIHYPQGFWGMDEQLENLPVVIVLDGESQFQSTVSTLDYLSSAPLGNDVFPRAIIVGIPNTDRNRDLTPVQGIIASDSTTIETTGGGPKFLDFITSELIPYIDKKYSTCNHRTIVGHSLGGLITFEALLQKREYFNNYVAIDPGFGFANESYLKQVLDTLRTADLSSENLYFAAANTLPTFLELEDLLSDSSDVMKLIDIPNRKFLNLDYAEEWQLNIISKHYPEENHFSVPLQATKDAFKFFYKFYSFREIMDYYHPDYSEKKDLISKIEDHYKMISELMDCKTIPMMGYINSFAFGIDASGRTDLAIELFEYNISLHPNSPIVYNNLGYYHMNKGYKIKAIEQFEKSLILKKDDNILSIRDRLNKEILEKK